ncbi:DUF2500 domain-containing protein [Shimazuella alba]|uniref:DUF2500 family protein n=1 Tax=Shimazuella alba TaxID=2690964 RepID=A0A6I4VV91_9BACL|nr:DUF2500 domain-containing protein [Shimazuella alba]MXQ52444.1 DUF2500 family protein [Shimazuella alba]
MEFTMIFFLSIFILIPMIIISFVIYVLISKRKQRIATEKLPILSEKAKVVSKRMYVEGGQYTRTLYFVTFEIYEKERTEFKVDDSEYGKLIEGDIGRLTFQGDRYKGFQRDI